MARYSKKASSSVERAMKKYREQTKDGFWEPASLLSRLAAEGKTFN